MSTPTLSKRLPVAHLVIKSLPPAFGVLLIMDVVDLNGQTFHFEGKGAAKSTVTGIIQTGGWLVYNNISDFQGAEAKECTFDAENKYGTLTINFYRGIGNLVGQYKKENVRSRLVASGTYESKAAPSLNEGSITTADSEMTMALLTEKSQNFSYSVSAGIVTGFDPILNFYMSTDLEFPDFMAWDCDSTTSDGTMSFSIVQLGTFYFDNPDDFTSTRDITYHAENTKDALIVMYCASKDKKVLGQFVAPPITWPGFKLDFQGNCGFTVTTSPADLLTAKTRLQVLFAAGTKVGLHVDTEHEGDSSMCEGENEVQSLVAKSTSLSGQTFYCWDWEDLGRSDWDYMFTLTRINKTPFVTFLFNYKVNPNTDPMECGYLPLKHLHHDGILKVSGPCSWSKH